MAHAIICDRCERVAKVKVSIGSGPTYPSGWVECRLRSAFLLCPQCVYVVERLLEPVPQEAPTP